MKKLMTVAVLLGLMAFVPAGAAEVGISGGVLTEAFCGMDYDLDSDAPSDFGQLRVDADLNFTVKLADNVTGAIDLRANNMVANSTAVNSFIIKQAYVEASEFLYQPLTLKIGKQMMHYSLRGDGNAMWLGSDAANLNNVNAAVADGVPMGFKARLNYNELFADIYYMKFDENIARTGDEDLYGFNIDYWLTEENLVNFYFGFLNDDSSGALGTTAAAGTKNYVGIIGLGCDYFLLDKDLELAGEVAVQFGKLMENTAAEADLFAYAFDLAVRYDWKDVNYKPWLELSFALRSGEDSDNDVAAWQPMFENNDKTLLVEGDDQVALADLASGYYAIRLGGGAQFTEKISAYLLFAIFGDMVDDSPAGSTAVNSVGVATTDDMIGFEVDMGAKYDYSENLAFGLDLGVFAPGSATEAAGASNDTAFGVLFTTKLSF